VCNLLPLCRFLQSLLAQMKLTLLCTLHRITKFLNGKMWLWMLLKCYIVYIVFIIKVTGYPVDLLTGCSDNVCLKLVGYFKIVYNKRVFQFAFFTCYYIILHN
jgi:hypothetical protein